MNLETYIAVILVVSPIGWLIGYALGRHTKKEKTKK